VKSPFTQPASLSWTASLALIWAAGAAARVAFVALEPETAPVADETMWLMALTRIPAAHFSPFTNFPIFNPPLYPYFLAVTNAAFGSLFAIKLVQALIGSLLIPAVGRVGARAFGPRAGLVAAALAAFYPELIWYAAHFWCETLFLAILWWAIERTLTASKASSRGTAVAAGLLFGLAVLTRETILYLLPLVAAWLAWERPGRGRSLAAATLTAAFVVVAPWTVRNWIQFETFIPVSTGGGLNLYQGNAPLTRGEVYDEYYANEGKVEQYRFARSAGIRVILSRQPAWLFEKIRDEGPKLAELDSLALIHLRRRAYAEPTCRTYRAASAIVLVPWFLIALCGVLGLARTVLDRQTVFLIGLLFAYLLLHIATHGFSRYRLPILPVLMIFAASLTGSPAAGRWPRWALLALMVASLGLLWAPSAVDQLGYLGLSAPSTHEGFAPVCPP
jgi:4-amino-4-deoxy-L-arabinose transferase-like glycosyltransferase